MVLKKASTEYIISLQTARTLTAVDMVLRKIISNSRRRNH